jgi:hypothetical protein
MAEEISQKWAKFSLSEEEDEEVAVQAIDFQAVTSKGQLCIVGKLIADRYVSMETIKTHLLQWWRPKGTINFKVIGENLFLINFELGRDKKKVLDGRPWDFEGNLFLVEDFDGRISPSQLSFERASFWVRMFELPLGCMGREVGRKIGASVGIVEEVDTDGEGIGWGESLRVKISMDLSKPLARGRKMNLEGKVIWIPFQYEKLPKFCFQCGTIRHGQEGCAKKSDLRNQGEPNFGPWLRAASPTRRADRNRGGFAPKSNKYYQEPSDPEGLKRYKSNGDRRGEERRRTGAGDGGAREPVEERNYYTSEIRKGGFGGANRGRGYGGSYSETYAEKGNSFMENNEAAANLNFKSNFPYRRDCPDDEEIVQSCRREKISPAGKEKWTNVSPIDKWQIDKGEKRESPLSDVGLKENYDKRPSPGGVYKGPKLTDIAKTFQEAQANHAGAIAEGVGKTMATWKRKEREWTAEKESGKSGRKKNVIDGDVSKVDAVEKEKKRASSTTVVVKNGSGLAEADLQPRRPQ